MFNSYSADGILKRTMNMKTVYYPMNKLIPVLHR